MVELLEHGMEPAHTVKVFEVVIKAVLYVRICVESEINSDPISNISFHD